MVRNKIICLGEINSTNSYLLDGDFPAGTVVSATYQTAGRGRNGKIWHSPPGDNLMFSLVLPDIPLQKLFAAQIAAGYAMVNTLTPYANVRMKWSNDIVCDQKKLAGMLIETKVSGNILQKAVLGIGVNIKSSPKDAVSLCAISGGCVPPAKEILEQSLNNINEMLDEFLNEELDISTEWSYYSANYMRNITFSKNGVQKTAVELGIQADGSLMVQNEQGKTEIITTGEIGYDFCI